MQPLDQNNDKNGQQLYRLSRLTNLPHFVKSANSEEIYGNDELENYQFADRVHRQFPCHTAAATYISALFFMDKKAELSEDMASMLEHRIDDFAFLHGILDRISVLKEKITTEEKNAKALSDSDYALILDPQESGSGKKEYYWPMRNILEVKKAAEALQTYQKDITYAQRQKIASRILDKVNEFNVDLSDLLSFVEKQAGLGSTTVYDVVNMLTERSKLLKFAGKHDYANKLAEMTEKISTNPLCIHDDGQLIKLASLVDMIDRESGLDKWISDLKPVENILFSLNVKMASDFRTNHFSMPSGNIYNLNDIDKLKLGDIKATLGNDIAEAMSAGNLLLSPEKVAEVAPTLPREDANLFDKLLSERGIKPIAKEAEHNPTRIEPEDWLTLSQLYKAS